MDDRRPPSRDRGTSRGWLKFIAVALVCAFALPASAKLSVARKKQLALAAYNDAERMRATLDDKSSRSRAEYQRVIDAYRKVYYLAPNSIKAEPAIVSVAELLAEEGRAFNDERLLKNAIGQYQFLRKQYPGSASRVAALFAIAHLYADDLNDVPNAKQTFQEFVRRYPRSQLFDDAKQALADLEAGRSLRKAAVAKNTAPAKTVAVKTKDADNDADIETRHAASPSKDAETVTQPKKASAKSETADASPSRSDLPPAVRAAAAQADAAVDGKLSKPELKKPAETLPATSRDTKADSKTDSKPDQPAPADASRKGKLPLVTGIRHWSTPDYTRIAVDLEQEVAYEVGRVSGPDRLFFDLHGSKLAPGLYPSKEYEVGDGLLKKVRVAQFQPGETRIVLDLGDIDNYQAFVLPNPYRLIVDVHGKKKVAAARTATQAANDKKQPDAAPSRAENKAPASLIPGAEAAAKPTNAARVDASTPTPSARKPADTAKTDTKSDITPADSPKVEAAKTVGDPKPDTPALSRGRSKRADGASDVASIKPDATADGGDDDPPVKSAPSVRTPRSVNAREAKPTAAGDRSLIRALGLKIGRIVVDAGHGGHDTGTIGPTGLLEKDLVLDVALRLGKLLETRMGADVVYTRDDDTFIPLETRTAIANREQADLFVSVHANSSQDPKARGVETYYLNFTTSADALEVAARENAVSDTSIHELQDLVKKIALKEKVEESKEFASDVQSSLRTGLSARGTNMRDRGVKKAPFIVLIGANMPSILAEISFVSNPADEKRLKTPDYRQKIAESLYRGIARYVSGLSGVKVAANSAKTGQ